jgi:hypothetical protein
MATPGEFGTAIIIALSEDFYRLELPRVATAL